MTGLESSPAPALRVQDLGRRDYGSVYALQRRLQGEVIAARERGEIAPLHLLLVEHDPPVITVSRRRGAREHVVAAPEALAAAGVEVLETDRGGDVTYHGPGQLVAYPIVDLNALGLRIHGYMRFLEQVVIETIGAFAVAGHRDETATGVWVGPPPADRKICAMGVRVSRWVAMHGLALNVTTNLDHFDLIVPCGIPGRRVTSLARELGPACPPMETVRDGLVAAFEAAIAACRRPRGSAAGPTIGPP